MQTQNRSFRLFIIGVILVLIAFVPFSTGVFHTQSPTVIRASLDIGSGATKLRVAEVDLKEHKIVKLLVNQQFTVPYQKSLTASSDMTFSDEVMDQGIQAIKKAKEIAQENGAKKVVAVATSAFRKASNANELVKKIESETGVDVFIIDQALEGELAYEAVKAEVDTHEDKMVVWDIGGGSLQLTSKKEGGGFIIYRGKEASEPFKNFIIEQIQGKDIKQVTTPNPMTIEQIQKATEHAKVVASRVDDLFQQKVKDPNIKVYGVGSVFSFGILPAVNGQNPVTVQELGEAVQGMAGKDDAALGGGDFADVQLSNSILIHGMMEGLEIPEVEVIDVNNADGAFFYEPFWAD